MGGGINILDPAIQDTIHIGSNIVNRYLYFSYISYYVEYLLRLSKHWDIDMYFMPGVGNSYYQYTIEGRVITQGSKIVVPIEPSACVEYDFTKWIGLYVQAGYRWMLIKNPDIPKNFNSPTYAFGVAVYPLEIYAALFPHTKLAHTIEDN